MNSKHFRQSAIAVLAALVFALSGAVLLAAVHAWRSASTELSAVANGIDARSERVRHEARELVAQLPKNEVCDEVALRRLLDNARYIRNIGKVRGNLLYCDALDGLSATIDLGPPEVVRDDGTRIWRNAIGMWAAQGTNALLFEPLSFIDTLLPAKTTVAVIEAESGKAMVSSEPVSATLARDAWVTRNGVFRSDGHLVAVVPSRDGRTLEFAARPIAAIRAQAIHSLPLFLLAGAIFGLALASVLVVALNRRRSLNAEMRRALKRCQFDIALQPIVRLRNGSAYVSGFECLARWTLRGGEEISPAVFVPMIEAERLGADFARCIITRLVSDFGDTLRAYPDIHVALNLSSSDVADGQLLDDIDRLLAEGGILPPQIVIELTERTFEAEGLTAGLERLRASGHRLSIDDFGTGASNASRLADYLPDMVKVDRSFVVHADGNSPAATLLPQLVAMARSCGARVVIEGIETIEQAHRLSPLGDIYAQGYYWHHPMNTTQAGALIHAEDARFRAASGGTRDIDSTPEASPAG